MFFIIITASKGIESVVCRRNLFRGKRQIKGKEGEGGGARETSSTSQGFPRRRRGGRDREKEKPAGTGSGENPDGKALSSRSRVHSLSSLDFPSLLLLPPPRAPYAGLVHFGLVGNILTISFSYRYPSYYEVRITRAVYVPGAPGPS